MKLASYISIRRKKDKKDLKVFFDWKNIEKLRASNKITDGTGIKLPPLYSKPLILIHRYRKKVKNEF